MQSRLVSAMGWGAGSGERGDGDDAACGSRCDGRGNAARAVSGANRTGDSPSTDPGLLASPIRTPLPTGSLVRAGPSPRLLPRLPVSSESSAGVGGRGLLSSSASIAPCAWRHGAAVAAGASAPTTTKMRSLAPTTKSAYVSSVMRRGRSGSARLAPRPCGSRPSAREPAPGPSPIELDEVAAFVPRSAGELGRWRTALSRGPCLLWLPCCDWC